MEPQEVIVYRSRSAMEMDHFWRENPELGFWLFVGIVGIIVLTLLVSWARSVYQKHSLNKFSNSVGLFNKRPRI